MKWFRKTKRIVPEVQAQPDVRPPHIMPNHDHIVALGYEAKQYITGFLGDLTRTQLMDFQDAKQFDGTDAEDAAWEAANDEEWKRDWPMGEHEYQERIPDIVKDTISDLKLYDLRKQVEGMQKKLDRLAKLVENTEVRMSGKTALEM